jgi:hypothetical protein
MLGSHGASREDAPGVRELREARLKRMRRAACRVLHLGAGLFPCGYVFV